MGVLKRVTAILAGCAIAGLTVKITSNPTLSNDFQSEFNVAVAAEAPDFNPPLSLNEINTIAKEMTVFISGESSGSGAIVARSGNTYSVLTAKEVVSSGGGYEVVTADGRRYRVSADAVKRFPLVDLAVLQFTSDEDYRVAQLASPSDSTIYLAVNTQPQTTLFAEGNLVSYPTSTLSQGYGLVYNTALQPTLSGGPVLDRWGRAIAIQGRFNDRANAINSAISIDTFLRLAPTVGLNLGWRGTILSNLIRTQNPVSAIALSPDGTLLANDAGNNAIQLWDWRSGELLYTLSGHNSTTRSLAIAPDNRTLVSGGEDGKVLIWNLLTGQIANTLNLSRPNLTNPAVKSMLITPNGQILATASERGIELWDLTTGQLTIALKESQGANAIAIDPSARTLASGHQDNTVRVWNLLNGALVHTLEAGDAGFVVESVAISPDGQTVAGGTYRQFRLWDIDRGFRKRTIAGHCEFCYVSDLAFTPDGTAIASTSEDGTKFWSLETGQLLRTLDASANHLAFPSDRTLIVGGNNIQIWQLPSP